MEGGSAQAFWMEGGQDGHFPTKAQEKREGGFSVMGLFWCLYRNMVNFLSSLWTCKDGKCRPTCFGAFFFITLISVYVYFTFIEVEAAKGE